MTALARLLVGFAAMLVLVSAVGVIWSKHQSRTTFIDLQRLQAERDRLDIEWNQLKIQQSFSATPGRVEQVAFAELKMTMPRAADVRIVQPEVPK